MFKWLRRIFGPKPPVDVHIHVHVDGVLKVNHEGGSGLPNRTTQGSQDAPTPAPGGTDVIRKHSDIEAGIGPELFASTDTPEVAFGNDIELPDKPAEGNPNKNS